MARKGWFNESHRHALASKGISTGRKVDEPMPMPTPKPKIPEPEKPKFNPPYQEGEDTIFPISDRIKIIAYYKKMRDGFNHYATLYIDGEPVTDTKIHYINRTWESYDFQSVIAQAVDMTKALTPPEREMAMAYIHKDMDKYEHARVNAEFGMIGKIAQLGEVFGSTQKEKNDWKARMLKAGLEGKGLEMPEDWDTLDEETKEARLNKVIAMMKQGGE